MTEVNAYEIINHGIDHSDYFQGCGTAFTDFEDVATGIGMSEKEALSDALESLAQSGWAVWTDDIYQDIDDADDTDVISPIIEENGDDEDYDAPWVHVSVRIR